MPRFARRRIDGRAPAIVEAIQEQQNPAELFRGLGLIRTKIDSATYGASSFTHSMEELG